MILVLTASDDATADYLCARLDEALASYVRVNTDTDFLDAAFSYADNQPQVFLGSRNPLRADCISSVWYRRPKPIRVSGAYDDQHEEHHAALEWTSALEGFLGHIAESRWINHPAQIALAMPKLLQLTLAAQLGLATPKTLISTRAEELTGFWHELNGRVVVKPLHAGHIERQDSGRDSVIYTNRVHEYDLLRLANSTKVPTFFQEEIPEKKDIRVTMVDGHYVAHILTPSSPVIDIRRNNMAGMYYEFIPLPDDVANRTRQLMDKMHLRFGAIDFAMDRSGRWWFLEINPNGQWAWMDLVAGAQQHELFLAAFRRDSLS